MAVNCYYPHIPDTFERVWFSVVRKGTDRGLFPFGAQIDLRLITTSIGVFNLSTLLRFIVVCEKGGELSFGGTSARLELHFKVVLKSS